MLTLLQIWLISVVLIQSISSQNCSLTNVDDRYGELGGGDYDTMSDYEPNSECQMIDIVTNAFSIAGSTTVYPVSKVWAIEYFDCAHKGCAQIL